MVKTNISFRLDKNKYKIFVEQTGGKPSEFIQQVIDYYLGSFEKSSRTKLEGMRLELAALHAARHLLLHRLREIEMKISELEEHIQVEEAVSKMTDKDKRFAELMKELNEIIRDCEYEFNCSWSKSAKVRSEFNEIGFPITREWLLKQIERILTWG